MDVAPSVLSFDYSKFNEQITILNNYVNYLHFDVMDGHFVPNISFGPSILKTFKKHSDLFMDVHLMISNPRALFDDFINAGANAITFHFEAVNYDVNRALELIDYLHRKKVFAGISIKPITDVEAIKPLLNYVDFVLIMSVEPGFGGQEFMYDSLKKINFLNIYRLENCLSYKIEIDGGINDETALLCKKAGVDIVVAGSYIFNGNIKDNIIKLQNI